MQSKVLRGLFLMAAGIIMITKSFFIGLILLGGGLYSLVSRPSATPRSKSRGLEVPMIRDIRQRIRKVQKTHARSVAKYPELREEFDEILTALWEELSYTDDHMEWRRILDEVLEAWPTPFATESSPLRDSIAKARIAADAWRTAHQQAHRETVI